MNTGLERRVVMVTGASSGLGRTMAIAFAAEGARVAVTYQSNRVGANETVAEAQHLAGDAMAVALDLEDDQSIDEAFLAVERKWAASPAILVNNAVTTDPPWGAFERLQPATLRRALRANVEGTVAVTQAAARGMKEAGFGRVVMISSIVSEDGLAEGSIYAAGKAALDGLTRSLARELASGGILVNGIKPGLVALHDGRAFPSPELYSMTASSTPTGRLTTPDEVATLAVFLGSEANGHINGELIRISGGPSGLS